MDSINVNILAVILYNIFEKCYRENWVQDTRDLSVLFLTTACECIIISIKISIKNKPMN